jgi:hypothetical protein
MPSIIGDLADKLFLGAIALGLAALCAWLMYRRESRNRFLWTSRKPSGKTEAAPDGPK